MKTTFTTILATTAIIALGGQALNIEEIENNPFYKLISNRFAENYVKKIMLTQAEAESCVGVNAKLFQGDDEHIAIKSDRWDGPDVPELAEEDEEEHFAIRSDRFDINALAQVETPTCGSTFDRQAGIQPNVDQIIAAKSVWTDSAYVRSVALDGMDNTSWGWKRAQERYTTALGHSMWGEGGLEWHSLNQGSLGDCWFLCSMQNMGSKDPNMIKNLFLHQELNDQRVYGVQFWNLGVPMTTVIDDYIPTYSWGDSAMEAISDNKGMWPILLEKAFGKFHGNYKAVEGGQPSDAITTMTGFPGWYTSNQGQNIENLWTTVKDELQKGGMLAAGTLSPAQKTYTNGLVNNHAYAILGAYTLSNGVRVVKMSNPWGVDVYTGAWSDKSTLWTQALRNEVKSVDNEQDGVFFQPIEQLLSDWHGVWFSKNLTGWKHSYWLNKGRDIKSTTGGTSWFCKDASCRANKFVLTSAVTQQIWIGVGTHEARDYSGCSVTWRKYWHYAGFNNEDQYFSMWDAGMQWKGPYTLEAGVPKSLNLELNILVSPLRNDWSVIAWGEKGLVTIEHSDKISSDAGWSLQQSSDSTITPVNPIVDPIPTPTPTPIVVTNTLDTYVQSMPAMFSTYSGCNQYQTKKATRVVMAKTNYLYIYGHMCTSKNLKLTMKFSTTQYKNLVQTTSQFSSIMSNCADLSTSYKQCDFVVKSGLENQLGFEFVGSATVSVVKGVWQ